jgi:hypothetical protein
MLILEFKLVGKPRQYDVIDEAIRTTPFIRNKCVRYWQDTRGVKLYDLNTNYRGAGGKSRLWTADPVSTRRTFGGQGCWMTQESHVL